jgi:hypothetical protein
MASITKFTNTPQALFGLDDPTPADIRRLAMYIKECGRQINSKSWSSDLNELIDCLPQILHHVSDTIEVPPDTFPILDQHPYIIYQMYLQVLNPHLEMVLQLHPEYCYYLLQRREYPLGQRPYLTASDLKQKMLADPNWALRWCREENDTVFLKQVKTYINKTKDLNSRSALASLRLYRGNHTHAQTLEELRTRPHIFTLPHSPETSLWLAEHYPELEPTELFGPYLRSEHPSPAMLLHLAVRFPSLNQHDIGKLLLKHPAWLPDFISLAQPDNARELWAEAKANYKNPWLKPWIEQYQPNFNR